MLKLRQWTSSSKKDADPAAAAASASNPSTGSAPPGPIPASLSASPSVASSLSAKVAQAEPGQYTSSIASHSKNAPSFDNNGSKTGSELPSSSASVISSNKSPDGAESDPDVLMEREIEKRKTGNARLNGAVEALWSNMSKKKGLPFDMSNAQLAAVLAKIKEDEEEETAEAQVNGSDPASGKNKGAVGGLASALADLLPGGGGKDKDKEKPDSKMVPINALGIAMTSYSQLLADSVASETTAALPSASTTLALSSSLGMLGHAYMQIALLQTTFASDMKSVLLTRLARSHVQLDAYAGARKRADAARSRLDSARSKAQKSKREKRELEDELRIASAAYDDAVSELEMRAEAVLYTSEAEDLSALTDFLHSHLDFLHQSVECLERVKDKWAHVDERALNRGINAGTPVSNPHSTITERPRSRATSLLSNSNNNTVRARKPASRPGTANSITAAMAAGAGRFGFPSGSRARSGTQSTVGDKAAKGQEGSDAGDDDDRSDSALSDEEGGDTVSPKKKAGKTRTKSSGSNTRPAFNRSLSRLGIFGGGKKDDAPSVAESKDSAEGDKAKSPTSPEKDKGEERPGMVARGWSDTFKAKTWRREKDRDTGGFANFGDGSGAAALREQRFDEDEERRRADLLSGVSIGVLNEDGGAERAAPRLPKRHDSRRGLSTDSYDAAPGTGGRGTGTDPAAWEMFGGRGSGGHKLDPSDFDDGSHLGHIGRRESSATTDIFQDGSAIASPMGHSPFPSEGMDMRTGGRLSMGDDHMLAFNNTGLSALSAGDELAGGLPSSASGKIGAGQDNAGSRDTVKAPFRHANPNRLSTNSHLLQQDTGVSLGGITDPASHSHDEGDGDDDGEEERAVLTSNGASTQKQRYRSGGMLSRMTSGGVGGAGAGPNGGVGGTVTGGRGAIPPPPIPSSSMFLKNRAPPPPPPSRANK
ncbi:hypothetical protein CF327_g3005 [Tilletia walkeri]|uniref:BAR domain-containing protein n=1 Tax=Tilletia walkeri TaxID=117179 RepID=A0A8X7NC99_9BASI|nr:hypothetical protein CF327_g3005 [Tilletia walkeri]KAE8271117.1 hypothetical protein A4X09_0g1217 [Tilletia walkeri]